MAIRYSVSAFPTTRRLASFQATSCYSADKGKEQPCSKDAGHVGVCGNCAVGACLQHAADDGLPNTRAVEYDNVYWCWDCVGSGMGSEECEKVR